MNKSSKWPDKADEIDARPQIHRTKRPEKRTTDDADEKDVSESGNTEERGQGGKEPTPRGHKHLKQRGDVL
ncbi:MULTISPECIES: hypothetical protein [unclassified Pandoraea]|uniref:hypothetical protein n=1 Tax=unclassified Pandoraea TaxID=2624094 RepID=UPI001124F2EC|nr:MULTISPECIES: hypothetical protein [unclassified Pandoraea]